jgi:antitoxin CcdA
MERNDGQRKNSPADRKEADRLAELWLIENKEALDTANAYIAKHGLPLARFRPF